MKLKDLIADLKQGEFARRAAWPVGKSLKFLGETALFHNAATDMWEIEGPIFEAPNGIVLEHGEGASDDWEKALPVAVVRGV